MIKEAVLQCTTSARHGGSAGFRAALHGKDGETRSQVRMQQTEAKEPSLLMGSKEEEGG